MELYPFLFQLARARGIIPQPPICRQIRAASRTLHATTDFSLAAARSSGRLGARRDSNYIVDVTHIGQIYTTSIPYKLENHVAQS